MQTLAGAARPDSASYHQWYVAGKPVSVRISREVVKAILRQDRRESGPFRRGAQEVGGILIGTAVSRGVITVAIEGCLEVPPEHLFGPCYSLSESDKTTFREKLDPYRYDGRMGAYAVGFYRTHRRKGLALDGDDLLLMSEFFPDPGQVALLVKPATIRHSTAACFIWEGGNLRSEESYLVFRIPWRKVYVAPDGVPAYPEEPPAEPGEPEPAVAGDERGRSEHPPEGEPDAPVAALAAAAAAGAGAASAAGEEPLRLTAHGRVSEAEECEPDEPEHTGAATEAGPVVAAPEPVPELASLEPGTPPAVAAAVPVGLPEPVIAAAEAEAAAAMLRPVAELPTPEPVLALAAPEPPTTAGEPPDIAPASSASSLASKLAPPRAAGYRVIPVPAAAGPASPEPAAPPEPAPRLPDGFSAPAMRPAVPLPRFSRVAPHPAGPPPTDETELPESETRWPEPTVVILDRFPEEVRPPEPVRPAEPPPTQPPQPPAERSSRPLAESQVQLTAAPLPESAAMRGRALWASWWVQAPLLLCVLFAYGLLGFFTAREVNSIAPAPQPAGDPYGIALNVVEYGEHLHLNWDRESLPIARSERGVLEIVDGEQRRTLDLTAGQLRKGSVVYRRLTPQVRFRLEIFLNGRRTVAETWEAPASANPGNIAR